MPSQPGGSRPAHLALKQPSSNKAPLPEPKVQGSDEKPPGPRGPGSPLGNSIGLWV